MPVGPLELLVLGFEGNHFRGAIAPAIEDASRSGAVRIVDLVFVRKDGDGSITALELEEAGDEAAAEVQALGLDLRDLLTEDDAMTLAELLPANTSAMVALIEHTWAARIGEAVANAGGRLLASQRISRRSIEAIGEEIEELLAAPARS